MRAIDCNPTMYWSVIFLVFIMALVYSDVHEEAYQSPRVVVTIIRAEGFSPYRAAPYEGNPCAGQEGGK